MKKILLAVALIGFASVASAQHYRHYPNQHYHHNHRGNNVWVPLIGGAIAGAVIYDIYNRPVVVQQPPVVQNPPVVISATPPVVTDCTAWVETMNPDGSISKTRTCVQR